MGYSFVQNLTNAVYGRNQQFYLPKPFERYLTHSYPAPYRFGYLSQREFRVWKDNLVSLQPHGLTEDVWADQYSPVTEINLILLPQQQPNLKRG
ncbi:hypothetical protein RRG08_032720 [Elysia crispata]|uniref:Uncharacterized protein n=1 Tax=Elysia crispata TaxID=231223 RepID=A0AAE0YVC1_9GAST|nr:hypothetical protein RRG08_032720 [Elysia crispata]